MDSGFSDWEYLATIVGNFQGLIEYYFGSFAFMAPWFRQASVGILYSLGLAWAGLTLIKAPVDRFLAAMSVVSSIVIAGILLIPTTDTENLGGANGTELSIGAYYSFFLAGSITQNFQNVVEKSWKASLSEANGGAGPRKEAISMAFADKAAKFADKFIKGEGKEAVLDYYQQCGAQAVLQAKTPKEKSFLKSIGLGANTLGMSPNEAAGTAQLAKKSLNGNADLWDASISGVDMNYEASKVDSWESEARAVEADRAAAEEFLKKLPPSNSKIDGTKGYRIPTVSYYKAAFSEKEEAQRSNSDAYKKVSNSSSDLAKMLPNGAVSAASGDETEAIFYPKNCYDLYKVAAETMSSVREGVRGLPDFKQLELTGQYTALSTAAQARRGVNDEINEKRKAAGVDDKAHSTAAQDGADVFYSTTTKISNFFDKWMLEYGIPTTVSVMAMIVALLLATFPVFALVSVMFGPKVLVSYFKLMAFPFIVVFINNLLLSLSAGFIAYNKLYAIVPETFNPGGVDTASALAGMSAETIIYATICVCEVAIAKFILWDDVRAVTSFNPAAASSGAMERGSAILSKVVSTVSGVFGKAATVSKAASSSQAASGMSQAVASINRQVTMIANGASRSQKSSPITQGVGGQAAAGNAASGATSSGSGGMPGGQKGAGNNSVGSGNSLNPPKPPSPPDQKT